MNRTLNFTLVLIATALVMVISLALLAATRFMVTHLLFPDLIVPTS